MTIEYAILGFLNWRSLSGYDLKKLFSESSALYWSGSNNQIYRALVSLHERGWVLKKIEYQEERPNRNSYTITYVGRDALREWLLKPPELPQYQHSFLVQLTWADLLDEEELDSLLDDYEDEIKMRITMRKEEMKRESGPAPRTSRESLLWQMIKENEIRFYQNELDWIRRLQKALKYLRK